MNKLLALLLFVPCFAFGAVVSKGSPVDAGSAPQEVAVVPGAGLLNGKLVTDLQAAIVEANAAHDPMAPVRAKCYQTLLNHVSDLSAPAAPVGPISAFERAAELAEGADAGVPIDIRVDCAPVALRARDILLKFGLTIKAGTILLP